MHIGFLSLVFATRGALAISSPAPIVNLPYAKFQGKVTGNLTQFLGMPFAQPPLEDLRFRLAQPPKKLSGTQQAFEFGPACPQLAEDPVPLVNSSSNYTEISEDCLTINVIKPTNSPAGKKLPVAFWIHGGGFEVGDSTDVSGLSVIERSIALNEPIIYVTANHRLNAFGFLGGKEVHEAGQSNIGLYDQRFALQWVQDHITAFGGDPNKVTVFGGSAGAISIALHLTSFDGKPGNLFQAAFMQSGGPTFAATLTDMQPSYNFLVQETNCSTTEDTLDCLRHVPFDDLMVAVNKTPNILSYSSVDNTWKPVIDGILLKRDPLCATAKGLFANVPIISGNSDDEGTSFSLSTLNVTTDDEFVEYAHEHLVKSASPEQLEQVAQAYPSDPAAGSPFDTGTQNALTPQYKRFAAIQGDLLQGPRRFLAQSAAKKEQKVWGYLNKRGKATPILGAFHGSDVPEWYALNNTDFWGADALINFFNTFDPNKRLEGESTVPIFWPEWNHSEGSPALLMFSDPMNISITEDTYRSGAIKLLNELGLQRAEDRGVC